MVSAWDVTRFYAMLTFCINSIANELLKIVFFEKQLLFFLSILFHVKPDLSGLLLAKRLSVILHGHVYPSAAWCLELFINGDYFSIF